ncbi:MAG: carboxypeptidase-like regulatory domain-containing protein, partial [Muribaculaceae bacterium]|nr:carboxypeptidase-like regulatory domain-containing protein [Muribaculaceae bacterium]
MGAYAQQFTATGVVSSGNDGELLPGVTVRVKGQKTGTSTDIDGRFSINVKAGDVLEFSY